MTHKLTRLDVATVEGLASAISLAHHKIGNRAKWLQDLPFTDSTQASVTRAREEFAQALADAKADFEALTTFLAERA